MRYLANIITCGMIETENVLDSRSKNAQRYGESYLTRKRAPKKASNYLAVKSIVTSRKKRKLIGKILGNMVLRR